MTGEQLCEEREGGDRVATGQMHGGIIEVR